MTRAKVYGETLRDGLLSVLDTHTADELLTRRPDLAEDVAIAIGGAHLRAVADARSFAAPLPYYDLDAALGQIHENGRALARGRKDAV